MNYTTKEIKKIKIEKYDLNKDFIKKIFKKNDNDNYIFIPTSIEELIAIFDIIIMDDNSPDLRLLHKQKKIILHIWIKNNKKPLFNKIIKWILDFLYNLFIIVIIVSTIRVFLISPFKVSGMSMYPTLLNRDYIIINKLNYFINEPEFWDIVIFTPPTPRMRKVTWLHCLITKVSKFNLKNKTCILPDLFIKRIIWEPNDVIEIKNWKVYRNNKELIENFLSPNNYNNTLISGNKRYKKYVVPKNKYFVLGDNRTGSSDSRATTTEWTDKKTGQIDSFVKKEDIIWNYSFRLISLEKIKDWLN